MTTNFPQFVKDAADNAAAPIVLAGALDTPAVNPANAKRTLDKLGIPTTGKVIVTLAYDGCGTHDLLTLEKAARENKAPLYVIYGRPDEPGLENPGNHGKISIGLVENSKPRGLTAEKFILAKDGSRVLPISEIRMLAVSLGLTLNQTGAGISSNGSALYENGVFKGIIADKETAVGVPKRTSSLPDKRSAATLV